MDFDAMKVFLDDCPSNPEGDDHSERAVAWLASGDLEVEQGEGEGCSIVALMVDEDGEVRVFAIPDDQLDGRAHLDLGAVSGSGFAWYFTIDLQVEQFAGAFRILGGSAEEIDLFEELVEEFREESDQDEIELDWEALVEGAGSWNAYQIEAGATLPGPITHCYAVRLSM